MMPIYQKLIYVINEILNKTPASFFVKIDNDYKIYTEIQRIINLRLQKKD